jgi:bifunctional DNase/RNase
MKELKIQEIKLKIIRGRTGPAQERFEYSTLIEYYFDVNKNTKQILTMGIIPPTYFFLKQVLNEDLDDLERVIFHSIQSDNRKILQELFIENNLMKISLMEKLDAIIDRVVIDSIIRMGKTGYKFAASLYLNNGERIPNVIPSDAVILAILGKKDIYILDELLEEKQKAEQEIEEHVASKKEQASKPKDEIDEPELPKNIYT